MVKMNGFIAEMKFLFKSLLGIKTKPNKNAIRIVIPEGSSGLRALIAMKNGETYIPLLNISEARKYTDSYLIMEGDSGGQIYLVIPTQLVKCSDQSLESILKKLDNIAWPSNKYDGANIFFERHTLGDVIIGGGTGGKAEKGLWIHDDFLAMKSEILSKLTTEE